MEIYKNVKNPNNLRIKEERIIQNNELFYSKLKPVFNDLHQIPYAVIKGEVLSVMAYGDIGFRDSGDIDILVSRNNINEISEILNKYGFRNMLYDADGSLREMTRKEKIMFMNSHQVAPFYSTKDIGTDMSIDVNVDLFWGEYTSERISVDSFLGETQFMDIHGCKVKTLSILHSFIEVCLHHYKEMNSIYSFYMKNPFSTYMYQDLYCFYKRHFENNSDSLVQFVLEHNLQEIFYFLFYYTNKVFQDPSLNKIIEVFEVPSAIENIKYYGLAENERKQWQQPFEERLDHADLFSLIKSDLNEADLKKINTVVSVLL
jgi:hypothetical protein